ncbi:DUF669 domain-containing protein, partial [Candidatus Woesearchaeota archaeon]|nr:DUF669 domain-containing protein [Candidatus Woesearchaeota archaeon]
KEEMQDFSVIPVGKYNVQITKSELVDTAKKNGQQLKLQFKVIDGKFKGRMVFAGLNIDNPNPKAVDIAIRELTSIVKACGKVDIQDSSEIHGIPLTVSVKITPASGNYPEKNEITKYEKYSGGEAATSFSSSDTDSDSDSEDNKSMPWDD